MAQLQEDEWPGDDEPTTAEREQADREMGDRPDRPHRAPRGHQPLVPIADTGPDNPVD